jgi:uncharacterized protein
MRKLYAGLCLLTILASSAQAERAAVRGEKLFLWKASSDTTTVYLLGSIHMAKKELYPLAAEIEQAFERSKYLVVEADESMVDPAKLQQMVMDRGLYKEGESLSKTLTKEKLKNVETLVSKVGLTLEQVDRMKPWLLALTASVMNLQKLGYDPQQGIDRHFIKGAKDKGKEIRELESVEFQLDLLSGFSEDLQNLFVVSTADELEGVEKRMDQLFGLWKKGDDKGLEKLMITDGMAKHPEMAPLQKKMLDDRNVTMAQKVEGYLKTKDVHFVVVGSAHLVGEKGMCELLRKKGVKVEQVEHP